MNPGNGTSPAGMSDNDLDRLLAAANENLLAHIEATTDPTPALTAIMARIAPLAPATSNIDTVTDRDTYQIAAVPADYREAGGSLRVSVSTDEIEGDRDWFDLGVRITIEGCEVPFADVFTALSRGESYLLLPNGAYFSLDKPELRALARLIEEARALHDSPADQLRISRYQAGFWDELAALGVTGHQAAAWCEQVQGLLSADVAARIAPPPGLKAELLPYQQDGFSWLAFLWEHRLGGILADDMGLGKTLQCLALISHARQRDPAAGPFLIVAPTSVVAQWVAEAVRFAPDLRVVTVSGTVARLGLGLGELAAGADAVITSYALLRIDFAAYAEVGWSGLLLDEAQQVKNRQSKVYQCARKLAAPVKIAITGTPLENNLMELWSLLSITAPGLFPSPDRFRDYYARLVEWEGDSQRLAQLHRRIRPLVLRRTKEQVAAELPTKQEQVLEVELLPQHREVYQTWLQRERQKVLGLIGDMDANRFAILRSLTLLRQLSLHAGLVDETYADLASAKIDALLGQLHEVTGGGHRALVFSQFTRFLGKVRERLEAEGIPYCYLDGGTRDRAAVVRRFRDGAEPGLPDQPQGRRVRAEPPRGRPLLPARPVVEPSDRSAGRRPHPPYRADPQRHDLPPGRQGHHRGEGHGAEGQEGQAVRQRPGRRQRLRHQPRRRRHPRLPRRRRQRLRHQPRPRRHPRLPRRRRQRLRHQPRPRRLPHQPRRRRHPRLCRLTRDRRARRRIRRSRVAGIRSARLPRDTGSQGPGPDPTPASGCRRTSRLATWW